MAEIAEIILPKYQEYRNLLKKWTFFKLYQALLLGVSYILARYFKIIKPWGLPLTLSIEPTTACNLGCPECPSGLKSFSRPTGNLKKSSYYSWVDSFSKHVHYINFYFQGEPFIHTELLDFVKYASNKGIYTSTSTNAHFLNQRTAEAVVLSGLDRIVISIDGTDQATYEQYRINGNLSKVIDGTQALMDAKKKLNSSSPFVIFQFLVVKPNEHQIEDVLKLGESMGVDEVRLKTAQIYNPTDEHHLIPTVEKYSRYKRDSDGTYRLKNAYRNECLRMWLGAVITWDGKVVPCCFDKDAKHQMGDLNQATLADIWKNNDYQSFRKKVFTQRKQIDICSNCSEGTKVWA